LVEPIIIFPNDPLKDPQFGNPNVKIPSDDVFERYCDFQDRLMLEPYFGYKLYSDALENGYNESDEIEFVAWLCKKWQKLSKVGNNMIGAIITVLLFNLFCIIGIVTIVLFLYEKLKRSKK